ncbi:MAG: hypothetical protein IT276_04715 [Ignavibacteriaceae bacterium]|nr:hypothetical protein [Ignavibacterium sp.]MCC6254192.1 hypothetical protein [Ignavibacteriaceae bacterium]HRN25846.1 hypothetical protein [Ignavibacteriaceae bacterium]HRP91441.1 hypothetical protein [Ignavibacteriaceae bacterium]HRQ53460.1 hypothetical protein [Ignavibacteriaceae bacterium]
MGYTTLLDILGSVIIGGVMMTIAYRLSDTITERTYNHSGELTIQQNLATAAQIIEYDFRKIGYCKNWNLIPDPTKALLYADTSEIKFYTDIDDNGTVDSIHYYLGPTSELIGSGNPRDRLLYRVLNGEPHKSANLGITQFYLVYFDALGDTLTPPIGINGGVTSIEINLTVESTDAYDQKYSKAFWRQIRMVSRNLRNR